MQVIEDDERLLESHKKRGQRVLALCNIDSLSMKLDHGATAEQLKDLKYKLFTTQDECVQATMDEGKGKQTPEEEEEVEDEVYTGESAQVATHSHLPRV
jgi:hypothetical protein